MEDIMVSIFCITYNHAECVKDALEGFLMQKTDFCYEIVIHDDASTDGTPDIIRAYEKKYPDLIRVIYQKENQYSKNINGERNLNELQRSVLKGKYIAICEGDDYWTDSKKLQRQIDYMEKHPECMLTVHDAVIKDYKKHQDSLMSPYQGERDITPEEMIIQYNGNLPTASMIYRREALDADDFFFEAGVGDYPLQLYCVSKGTIHYFPQVMSVYRYMFNGSWTQRQYSEMQGALYHWVKMIELMLKYNEYTGKKYDKYVISKVQQFLFYIMALCEKWTVDSFNTFFDKVDKETGQKYCDIVYQVKKSFKQVYNEKFCDERLKEFVRRFEHIYIMGAGRYAGIVAKQLHNNEIDFEGFVISDNQENKGEYFGKKVLKFKDLPNNKGDIGIIVAINPEIWAEIVDILEENNVSNFICPFLMQW